MHLHIVTKEEDSINSARHKITIDKNSLLYEIIKKETLDVVSLHGMEIARVPKNIFVSIKSCCLYKKRGRMAM